MEFNDCNQWRTYAYRACPRRGGKYHDFGCRGGDRQQRYPGAHGEHRSSRSGDGTGVRSV